jgi:hypothetical protein
VNNPGLPTLWVDTAQITLRDEPAVGMIRFYALFEEGAFEVCRVQTPLGHIAQLHEKLGQLLQVHQSRMGKAAVTAPAAKGADSSPPRQG